MTLTTPSAPSGTAGRPGNEQINPFSAVVGFAELDCAAARSGG